MRVAALILFFLFSIGAMAQSRQFAEFLGWTGRQIELQTIHNRTRQSSCTFVISNDSIRAFIFTGQLKLMRQFSLPRRPGTKLLGGFLRDSSLYMFTEQQSKGELYCLSLNVVTSAVNESLFRLDPRIENKVACISAGNHFVYITANYSSKELCIYDFPCEQPGTSLRCQFSDAFWRDLTSGYTFPRVRLQQIDHEGEMDMDALVRNNKLYMNNGSVLLVMNNHIDSTYLVNFDLNQQTVNSWMIDHNPGKEKFKAGPYSDNSFFFRNKLYYVRATSDKLMVQVIDPVAREINKTYSTKKGNEIAYKNTPIIQEETSNNKIKDPRDLNKTSQLLRRMISGSAVITAKAYGDDQVELQIGSYEKNITTTVIGSPYHYHPLDPFAHGYTGTMSTPSRIISRRVIRKSWTQATHFKMLLNAQDHSHVPGEPVSSAYERIGRYTATMKTEPEAENIFEIGGQYYYIYYDKAERKLVVLKF